MQWFKQLSFFSTLVLLNVVCHSGIAQEFRVETDVFVEDEEDPVVQTLTIFSDGVVYDFLRTGTEEITLFDHQRNRLVLMDTRRKVKSELTMDGIMAFVAAMKSQLNKPQREYLLEGNLKTSTDEEGSLLLTNEAITYRVQGIEPKSSSAALDYRQFADWYARLNAMRLGNLPPFARIRLNAEIEAKGWIPTEIERTITQRRGLTSSKQVLRSRHLVNWRLSNSDRKLIDRAGTCLATYRSVAFSEYIDLPQLTAADRPR
jgi:hypothetical protein